MCIRDSRYADAGTWKKIHELGLKTTSTEEKQYYYEALGNAIDPKLIARTIALALTDELPTSRAALLLPFVARQGEHPELVWEFAQENMKALLAKPVSYTHLRAHETPEHLVCRL